MPNVLKIPIQGTAVGWVLPLDATGAEITGANTKLSFNDLAPGSNVSIPVPASVTTGETPQIEFPRTDGAKTRYAQNTVVIEGSSGELAGSADAGGGGVIVNMVTNNIPTEATNFKTFIKDLQAFYSQPVIAVLPLGKGYGTVSHSDIGYVAIMGKLTSAIDVGPDGNAAKTLTMQFTSGVYTAETSVKDAIVTALGTLASVTPVQGAAVSPPTFTSSEVTKLLTGAAVIL